MQKILMAIFSLLLLQFGVTAKAQRTVTGEVRDRATTNPLAGVTVIVGGTTEATTTNSQGQYTIEVPSGTSTLRFTNVGYETQSIALSAIKPPLTYC